MVPKGERGKGDGGSGVRGKERIHLLAHGGRRGGLECCNLLMNNAFFCRSLMDRAARERVQSLPAAGGARASWRQHSRLMAAATLLTAFPQGFIVQGTMRACVHVCAERLGPIMFRDM